MTRTLRPVGGLPPAIYWRRRAVLAGAVAMTAVLVRVGIVPDSGSPAKTHPAARERPLPTATPTPRPAPTPKPTPIGPCPANALQYVVGTDRSSYRVGQITDIVLTYVSVAQTTCQARLAAHAAIYRNNERLWSNMDCDQPAVANVTVRPGNVGRLVIRWAGITSKAGCGGHPRVVDAGRYTLRMTVGSDHLSGRIQLT